MKNNMKRIVIAVGLALFIFLYVQFVRAGWDSLNSGYAVTSNYHGDIVPVGETVIVTAGTTNPEVKTVDFIWRDPNENVVRETLNVPVYQNGTTWDGKLIYYANDSYTPNIVGEWGVQAIFRDGKGTEKKSDKIAIRATSFNTIPEVPLGTITIILLKFASYILFSKRHIIKNLHY